MTTDPNRPCLVKYTSHNNGYSTVRWEGTTGLSHRKAYADHHGLSRADLDGVVIRHTCDNRKCVEPTHLVSGTQQQNMADRKKPGVPYKKLSVDQVAAIRAALAAGVKGVTLSKKYGVSNAIISRIKLGQAWT